MVVTPNHRFCILRTSHDHSCILQSHQDGFTYPRKEYAACTFTLYQYLDDERHRMEFANDGFAELRQANENVEYCQDFFYRRIGIAFRGTQCVSDFWFTVLRCSPGTC